MLRKWARRTMLVRKPVPHRAALHSMAARYYTRRKRNLPTSASSVKKDSSKITAVMA
jgi:hypothetical protein